MACGFRSWVAVDFADIPFGGADSGRPGAVGGSSSGGGGVASGGAPTSIAQIMNGEKVSGQKGSNPGGFYIAECASREAALELAGNVPASPGAAVEVLTIVDV